MTNINQYAGCVAKGLLQCCCLGYLMAVELMYAGVREFVVKRLQSLVRYAHTYIPHIRVRVCAS